MIARLIKSLHISPNIYIYIYSDGVRTTDVHRIPASDNWKHRLLVFSIHSPFITPKCFLFRLILDFIVNLVCHLHLGGVCIGWLFLSVKWHIFFSFSYELVSVASLNVTISLISHFSRSLESIILISFWISNSTCVKIKI